MDGITDSMDMNLNELWELALQAAACQASLSITNSQSLLKLMTIGSVMPSNHLILCCPLLLLLSIFPGIREFSNESVLCIRWLKYWSFSTSPSNVYLGSISFRMDWFDLLAVQGTLKSLLHQHSSKKKIDAFELWVRHSLLKIQPIAQESRSMKSRLLFQTQSQYLIPNGIDGCSLYIHCIP